MKYEGFTFGFSLEELSFEGFGGRGKRKVEFCFSFSQIGQGREK